MLNDALKILEMINKKGYEAYIVGGYVRDRLLNIDSNDFDICTNAKVDNIKDLFDEYEIEERFGSIKVYINNNKYEITTYRKDLTYLDNRRPSKIEYVDNLKDDLLRRDFTINTICMDKDKNIIDLYCGKKDLDKKIIRVIGDTDNKIKEDSLRILRAIRFSTCLGFNIDDELDHSIKKYSNRIKELSFERKKYELDKILESDNYIRGIELLKGYNLLDNLDIKINNINKTDLIGMWAQIDFDDRYPFTKKERRIIDNIRKIVSNNVINSFTVYNYTKEENLIASDILKIERKTVDKLLNNIQIHNKNDIALSIDDVSNILKCSIMDVKDVYKEIESKIILNELKNNKDDIIKYIKRGE